MTERKTTHGPGPDSKGGGFRGGPKRWTGAGPAPARHIPWPEIFKHHISVVEGHLKMIDMVRKHTVEGSGNFRTIMGCVDRAKEMLQVSKHIARTFVPPPNHREQVPLGSSSASMYPGYSPADHEYGKAAEEYGKAAAEARAKGIELKHPDAEYEIGQAKGVKRKMLAGIREAQAGKGKASGSGNGSGTGSGSEGPEKEKKKEPAATNGQASTEKVQEATPEGENPYFIIDTNPTPVNLPGISFQPLKRSASPPEAVEAKIHKKAKKTHDGEMPIGEEAEGIQTEDISDQVDARMKEKEEKRKMKEEKKRKREPEAESAVVAEEPQATAEPSIAVAEVETPKKKKKKKAKNAEEDPLPDRSASKKRLGEDDGEAEDGEGKMKKTKRKKSKETATASDA
ncbi:MAG: hypothetical protein ASARMPRED_004509 [Alectoria sarmentosa]|nr:MAG: hypothetical protein ASARMPRED_004509 [Alectoria sarmentosa]